MTPKHQPTSDELFVARTARFVGLTKQLTKRAVTDVFDRVLQNSRAKRISQEIRKAHGSNDNRFVVSFLCFRSKAPVRFLKQTPLEELRYGYVLLVERRNHLAVFHHLANGLNEPVAAFSKAIDRSRVTHIWSQQARYQRLSTRRMTVSTHELRGASYDAADLETAFVPAAAARSILQVVGLVTRDYGHVGVTPSTGRVRVRSTRAGLEALFEFVDDVLNGIETSSDSAFLQVFPIPVDVADLPDSVQPTGLLFDTARVRDLLQEPDTILESTTPNYSTEEFLNSLSAVLGVASSGRDWLAVDDEGRTVAQVKRLTHTFGVYSERAKNFMLRREGNEETRFDRWLRDEHAFSLSFDSTEFFYTEGGLFRSAGFAKEVQIVRRFLNAQPCLDDATSEKGTGYAKQDTRFASNCIFRSLEDTIARSDEHLFCGDLGDEWADYIGVGERTITFYHCKHGSPTTGASDLQVVTAQALKNLSRVKVRDSDIRQKIDNLENRGFWGTTQIPLLARGPRGWAGLRKGMSDVAADPKARWQVALVVTALSVSSFDEEATRRKVQPHFIQLVWLLSSFISGCRERDAEGIIYCRP